MLIYGEKAFDKPIQIISAFTYLEVFDAFKTIEALSKKYYIIGYIKYELKDIFLGKNLKSKTPIMYFEIFNNFNTFIPKNTSPIINIKPEINYPKYKKNISKIKQEISKGNTYEVNYTINFKVNSDLEPLQLFNHLVQKQKTPFNLYLKNKYETVLSFSPELFFTKTENHICTKPMKGTIKRGNSPKEDIENIRFLKNDIKNRAENIMIVDLLRNDLSKISNTVETTKLFEIETHKTLHQMTSTIEADLEENTTLYDIFKAIFPCGSITGAPKINTMKIIEKLENQKRNIYCGAIGYLSPEKIEFSVPIRILQKENKEKMFNFRAGGAIVWDSDPLDEWKEVLLKTQFLENDFTIIETVKVENSKPIDLSKHLKRMKKTAKEFNFIFPKKINIKNITNGVLRIILNKNGDLKIENYPLTIVENNKIRISNNIINSNQRTIFHKTSHKPWYNATYRAIKNNEIFDEIFFNEKNELTEGARSNIFLQIGKELYTPPIKCGLLAGITREKLLKKGAKEKILYEKDLFNAEKIFCTNSLRGIVEVKLDTNR